MSCVQTEQVLVVPTSLLHELGYFQGFTADVARYLQDLLSPRHTSYRPRNQVEEDPGFKQLIPYVIFRYREPGGVCICFATRVARGKASAVCTASAASASADTSAQRTAPSGAPMRKECGANWPRKW